MNSFSFRFVKNSRIKGICSTNRKLLLTTDEKICSFKTVLFFSFLKYTGDLGLKTEKLQSGSGFTLFETEGNLFLVIATVSRTTGIRCSF